MNAPSPHAQTAQKPSVSAVSTTSTHPCYRAHLTPTDYVVQTWALFGSAYQELNARKLFWVALALNALIIGAVAAIGIDDSGISILGYELGIPGVTAKLFPDGQLYKRIFSTLGVGIWLAWLSTILALLSTASMFPDLATGGVDTMLSKPVGRGRLFVTKFATGLLFTALQVAVFAVLAFLVLGIRGGVWEVGMFVVIPLMVVFFSYLFAVQAVVGMITRSPIASVIVTLLFWIVIFLVHSGEQFTLLGMTASRLEIEALERKIETLQTEDAKSGVILAVEAEKPQQANWKLAHDLFYAAKTIIPKSTETIGLTSRALSLAANMPTNDEVEGEGEDASARQQRGFFRSRSVSDRKLRQAIQTEMDSRSVWWVVGTSFAFESVLLSFGIWYFKRRDF